MRWRSPCSPPTWASSTWRWRRRSSGCGSSGSVHPVELLDGDPAEDVIGHIEAGQHRAEDGRAQRYLAKAEPVRGALGMAPGGPGPLLFRRAHAERQDEEKGERP